MLGTKQNLGVGVIAVIALLLLSATISFAAETITNTYDELNRLTKSVFGSRFSIEYSYEAYGNRTQKTTERRTYSGGTRWTGLSVHG